MVQNSDKVQLGTPSSKPPDSGRPQTPPKAPWVDNTLTAILRTGPLQTALFLINEKAQKLSSKMLV